MTRFIAGLGICLALASTVAGQAPKYGVKVDADKNVDFAKFKTYSWTKGQPSAVKEIDAKVTSAVDRELKALGFTKAASGPGDVLAAYYSVTRTDVDTKAKADTSGARPQYTVGTLMVALLDPGTRKRLVRMRIDKPIETEPAKLDAAIDEAVAALFAQYPTRRPK